VTVSATGSTGTHVGAPLKRVEDRALLTGAGCFTGDVPLPGTLAVAFVRSPHAHARITRLDVAAAGRAPGVRRVATGADVRHLPPLDVNRFFPDMVVAPFPYLADGIARFAGEPVAAVVADTAEAARDAAAQVEVDYDVLPPLVDIAAALAPGAPVLHGALGTNRAFGGAWKRGDAGAGLAGSHRVARLEVAQPRLSGVCLEPRAILAAWDARREELTVWLSTQAPFRARGELATVLDVPETRIRVIAPDVGGGFGIKGSLHREECVVAWLAVSLRGAVRWIATRTEDFLATTQGRGALASGELGVDASGRITALRARIAYGLGPQLMFTAAGPARNHGRTLPGAYRVPAVDVEVAGTYTTTAVTGPYRGAGRPEGIFLVERLMDEAARALAMDPAEIRRRNFVPAGAFPYRTLTGCVYDSGDYATAFERVLELADYEGLRRWQAAERARGGVAGVGLAAYVEPAAHGWESGTVRVERTGAVTVVTGSSAHGQGHETTWAQIVADVLGVEPARIRVLHGDTRQASQAVGTFGSRSTALGGSAAFQAAGQVRDKARRIAARLLEAAVADVVQADGGFQVVGTPARRLTWRQVADAAHGGGALPPGDTPGLEATSFFNAEGETWSFGACVAVVAIDPETGAVTLTRCVWVDDAGVIVNPLLAEGQLHGSYAQGAGQALLEAIVYDEGGQLLTATLMDYAVPRAGDFVEPVLDKTVTPSPRNPLGVKGLGEAGCIAVPPAVVNAVVDALAPWGCTHLDMPITAQKVWRVLRRAPTG
jgi:carbon-monoxide dehydrogenase large subunit